jgi:hypothetical protein
MVVVIFWIVVEFVHHALPAETAIAPWRYLVAAGSFCPMMAVMGAKRPQDRGWQWIVLSLWVVLAIPVAQHFLFASGQPFQVFAGWPLVLGVLLALELLNYLPTRHAGSALLVAGAQWMLVGDSLDWTAFERFGATISAWLLLAAIGLAWIVRREARAQHPREENLSAATQRWLSFRDSFGAFWALRVLQRMNQTAEVKNWPVRLDWSGFRALPDRNDSAPTAELNQSLQTLLRRFMQNEDDAS